MLVFNYFKAAISEEEELRMHENEIRMESHARGLAEGRASGLIEGRNAGLIEGKKAGLAEGEAKGRASGLAEGRAAGLAEGEARGKTEAYSDVARKLKSLGCRLQDICDITGLSPEEINSLKHE